MTIKSDFTIMDTTVHLVVSDILQIDGILKTPRSGSVTNVVVSSDDNYLTMNAGVSRRLANVANIDDKRKYTREAQKKSPIRIGEIITTNAYGLKKHNIQRVFHAAVVDYDSYGLIIEEIVFNVTRRCLEEAERLEAKNIIFPTLATGNGGLSAEVCAQKMCGAIRMFLAERRKLDNIYIVLYESKDRPVENFSIERFQREADQILGIPFDPQVYVYQNHDLFVSPQKYQMLRDVMEGKQPNKRHVLIVSGSKIGKSALLNQFFKQSHEESKTNNSQKTFAARITLGHIHQNTPLMLIYRKLLIGLRDSITYGEDIPKKDWLVLNKAIKDTDVQEGLSHESFIQFLDQYPQYFSNVVFLIDNLAQLTKTADGKGWSTLQQLKDKVHFILTANDDDQYEALQSNLSEEFQQSLEIIHLGCIGEDERKNWIKKLYVEYLDGREPTKFERNFIAEEGGYHPYLINLALFSLIKTLKEYEGKKTQPVASSETKTTTESLESPKFYDNIEQRDFEPLFISARQLIDDPRSAFFDSLMTHVNLASATAEDDQPTRESLFDLVAALYKSREIDNWGLQPLDLRKHDKEIIARLIARGYLYEDDAHNVRFMSQPFAVWLYNNFVAPKTGDNAKDFKDITIALWDVSSQSNQPDRYVRTIVRTDSALPYKYDKIIKQEIRANGIKYFYALVNSLIDKRAKPVPLESVGGLKDLKGVGDSILYELITANIRPILKRAADNATITLEVDYLLKDVPWELIFLSLEKMPNATAAVKAMSIPPFNLGRIAIPRDSRSTPLSRNIRNLSALLISCPQHNLPIDDETNSVKNTLKNNKFTVDVLRRDECTVTNVMRHLESGKYGLIHYSGHSHYAERNSAWLLVDGELTTDIIMNSLIPNPPMLVFSSSCQGAMSKETNQPKVAENQASDLADAFISSGVAAYIGTLWDVEAREAAFLATRFYAQLMGNKQSISESLRQAKQRIKGPDNEINWAAYVLYGDPYLKLDDMFR